MPNIQFEDVFAARQFVLQHSTDYPAVRAGLTQWPRWKREKWERCWAIIGQTVNANYLQFLALTRKEEAGPRVKLSVKHEEEPKIIDGTTTSPISAPERVDSTIRVPELERSPEIGDRHRVP